MKTDIYSLQDYFRISYEQYNSSREEAQLVVDLYHNRQYTPEELAIISNNGQPAETFNVVKLFARMLLGYYGTVVNTVKVEPQQPSDQITASLLNDVVNRIFEDNQFETEGDKIKLDILLSGLGCTYENVVDTGVRDAFGRPINKVTLEYVPASEILLDPMSRREDYSDARYIHRFKWVTEDQLKALFPKSKKLGNLDPYYNHLNDQRAEFTNFFKERFFGKYQEYDCFLLVHTIITDDKGDTWSIYWIQDEILAKEKVTFKDVKNPYNVMKMHTSDTSEYYGIFREVIESQKAINQALIKIQQLVNTNKVLVEKSAVDDVEDFAKRYARVNAVIPVEELQGIEIINTSKEVADQYIIVDKALERIQRELGVNDSFLGMAYASDSGRKVKLQQNATILSLKHITGRIEQMYRKIGRDVTNLVKQYYTAQQVLRVADDITGYRWIELNQPMMVPTGQIDPNTGQPLMEPVFEEVIDPATGEPMEDDKGNLIFAPLPERDTEVAFSEVDISIDTKVYNDDEEKTQQMLETVISGPAGQMLAQTAPGDFVQIMSLLMRGTGTKYSPEIAKVLENTAQKLGGEINWPSIMPHLSQTPQRGPQSQTMRTPNDNATGEQ